MQKASSCDIQERKNLRRAEITKKAETWAWRGCVIGPGAFFIVFAPIVWCVYGVLIVDAYMKVLARAPGAGGVVPGNVNASGGAAAVGGVHVAAANGTAVAVSHSFQKADSRIQN